MSRLAKAASVNQKAAGKSAQKISSRNINENEMTSAACYSGGGVRRETMAIGEEGVAWRKRKRRHLPARKKAKAKERENKRNGKKR